MPEAYDAIILGAGVAGLTAANALLQQTPRVLCLDSFDTAGGNHRSHEFGGYSFDIGSIVLEPSSPLFARFSNAKQLCVPFEMTVQRLTPCGAVCGYPFDLAECFGGNAGVAVANILSLIAGRLRRRAPGNVEEYCMQILGRRLYQRLGLQTYIERFHGLPAKAIDVRFAHQRMQFVTAQAALPKMTRTLLRAARRKIRNPRRPAAKSAPYFALVRPRAGFPALYNFIRDELADKGARFEFGLKLRRIKKTAAGFIVETNRGAFRTGRLVSTIPINETRALLSAPSCPIVSAKLLSLYISFSGTRGFAAPILYNFDPKGSWKRLTMHSDAYGSVGGREYFSLEYPFAEAFSPCPQAAFQAFTRHVTRRGLFAGDLVLEGHSLTDYAYPVYTLGSAEHLALALREIEDFGIETAGRQGRFDYLPTVTRVIESVEKQLALQS